MLSMSRVSTAIIAALYLILCFILDVIFFVVCLFRASPSEPELPVVQVNIAPCQAGETNHGSLNVPFQGPPRRGPGVQRDLLTVKEHLDRIKKHASRRVPPDSFSLDPQYSPSFSGGNTLEVGSPHLSATRVRTSSDDSSVTTIDSIFSPTLTEDYTSCTSAPSSPSIECSSTLSSPTSSPTSSPILGPKVVQESGLGQRRGFKGTPLFTKTTRKSGDYLSPTSACTPRTSPRPKSPRSPLASVTNFILSPTSPKTFTTGHPVSSFLQGIYDDQDPFAMGGDSFFAPDDAATVVSAEHCNFDIYQVSPPSPKRKSSVSGDVGTRMPLAKTTVHDISIYDYSSPSKHKTSKVQTNRLRKDLPSSSVPIVLIPPSPPSSSTDLASPIEPCTIEEPKEVIESPESRSASVSSGQPDSSNMDTSLDANKTHLSDSSLPESGQEEVLIEEVSLPIYSFDEYYPQEDSRYGDVSLSVYSQDSYFGAAEGSAVMDSPTLNSQTLSEDVSCSSIVDATCDDSVSPSRSSVRSDSPRLRKKRGYRDLRYEASPEKKKRCSHDIVCDNLRTIKEPTLDLDDFDLQCPPMLSMVSLLGQSPTEPLPSLSTLPSTLAVSPVDDDPFVLSSAITSKTPSGLKPLLLPLRVANRMSIGAAPPSGQPIEQTTNKADRNSKAIENILMLLDSIQFPEFLDDDESGEVLKNAACDAEQLDNGIGYAL